MSVKIINGARCWLVKSGNGRPDDWVTSRERYFTPYKAGSGSFTISEEARKSGQGDIYRPIKTTRKRAEKVKAVRAFAITSIKTGEIRLGMMYADRHLAGYGKARGMDKIIQVEIRPISQMKGKR